MTMRPAAAYTQLFGGRPEVFRAPGRVNLIGEHTDYNEGFCLPMAIDLATHVAIGARDDQQLHLVSSDMGDGVQVFDLEALPSLPRQHWTDYPLGAAAALQASGLTLRGANLYISSTIPQGAGLSSSAALLVATSMALLHVSGHQLDRAELARLCQRAENESVGVPSGLMDPYASLFGQLGHALLIDCRSLQARPLAIPEHLRVVICDSQVRRSLRDGAYAERRADCEAGVRILQQRYPKVKALRDVEMWQLDDHRDDFPRRVYRRCRHVVGENERVSVAATALGELELELFGALMGASHDSLRDDYEVSCRELDMLVNLALPLDGVLGTRMTGAGFGGCTVSLVEAEVVDELCEALRRWYRDGTGRDLDTYVCRPGAGAGPEPS